MSEFLPDGNTDFSLGQDAWQQPDRIQANQYAKGVNLSIRSGALSPRNGYHELMLNFELGTIETKFRHERTYEDIWRSGKFQALIPHVIYPENYLLTVISGLIFRTNVRTGRTILLSKTIKLNQYASRINWSFAADKIVIFDYPDYPIIIENETVTRSSLSHQIDGQPAPQIPVSSLGTYNHNRLFVANAGIEITAGDPVGSLAIPEAPTTFAEVFIDSSPFRNQFFSLSEEEASYPIAAMGFIQELDQSLGVGPLFVATEKKFHYYKTQQPRDQWTVGQFSGIMLDNTGIAGARAFVNVNSDLIFASNSGRVHALSSSRGESKKWSNISISREVENYLKAEPFLRRFCVLGYFDNRLFVTAKPYRITALTRDQRPVTDYAHGGFAVLEIESAASLLRQGTPVWTGVWTGIDPMDLCTVGDRCFIIAKNGGNRIFELKKDSTFDMVGKRKRPVRSIIYTRSYQFGDDFALKRENSLSLHLQDLKGDISLKIERRPSHSHKFLEYAAWQHHAPYGECGGLPEREFANGCAPLQLRQLVFGDATEQDCNPASQDEYNVFSETQLRLTLQADYWTLNGIKMKAEKLPYVERAGDNTCNTLTSQKLPLQCEPDLLLPEDSLCQ